MKQLLTATTIALTSLFAAACGTTEDPNLPADEEPPVEEPTDPGTDPGTPDPQPEPRYAETCAELRQHDPAAQDGEHVLFVAGDAARPWLAYCADMATAPVEYLALAEVGTDKNFAQYTAGGASPGVSVRTSYLRLRIDPVTLVIDTSDQRFASSTGSLQHSFGDAVTSMPFGVAMSCGGGDGLANIDLTGTAFVLANVQYETHGTGANGGATMASDEKVVDVTGGGFCGWSAPVGTPFNPFNTAGGAVLALAYES